MPIYFGIVSKKDVVWKDVKSRHYPHLLKMTAMAENLPFEVLKLLDRSVSYWNFTKLR